MLNKTKWIELSKDSQLSSIQSSPSVSLIFKHSTRCPVSLMTKKTFEHDWNVLPDSVSIYYLDVIKNRSISDAVAANYNIKHESPQLLVVKEGQCVFSSDHEDISAEDVLKQLTY